MRELPKFLESSKVWTKQLDEVITLAAQRTGWPIPQICRPGHEAHLQALRREIWHSAYMSGIPQKFIAIYWNVAREEVSKQISLHERNQASGE